MSVEFEEQRAREQSSQKEQVILLLAGALSAVLFVFENATPSIVGGFGGVFLGIASYYLDSRIKISNMGVVGRSLYTIFFGAIGGATVYYALQIDSPIVLGLIASASLGAGISFVITSSIR